MSHDNEGIDDDTPVGRVLGRRAALALLGVSGAAWMLNRHHGGGEAWAQKSPAGVDCVATPQLTEGPYFVDEHLNRADIRTDPASKAMTSGVRLELALKVLSVDDVCGPIRGAQVDVWHCDASGVYSDVRDPGQSTVGRKFLRGYQVTDENGLVRFTTIYPGWYQGRAPHLHFKVRAAGGQKWEFTSQFFFDDSVSDRVYAASPYTSKRGRRMRNDSDGIYRSGGRQLLLTPKASGDLLEASYTIGIAPSRANRHGERGHGPGGPPPGGGPPGGHRPPPGGFGPPPE